ncbi:hypothetical protein GCM10027435_29230 [Haloparvum alkalitolerans]|uniref:hypothetical protein n=1 Tax=Haloparvum alkalitolerans TaxID=1042953 RepID=UPI003CE770EF
MTGYYDYILGLIPVALVGIAGLLRLVGLPELLAVPAGATVAVGLMAHAMFVNGPVADRPSEAAANSGVGRVDAD